MASGYGPGRTLVCGAFSAGPVLDPRPPTPNGRNVCVCVGGGSIARAPHLIDEGEYELAHGATVWHGLSGPPACPLGSQPMCCLNLCARVLQVCILAFSNNIQDKPMPTTYQPHTYIKSGSAGFRIAPDAPSGTPCVLKAAYSGARRPQVQVKEWRSSQA